MIIGPRSHPFRDEGRVAASYPEAARRNPSGRALDNQLFDRIAVFVALQQALGIKFDAERKPADDTFAQLFADAVLLVRPDGHIAARFTAAGAGAELEDVVSSLFPRSDLGN